MEIYLLCIVSQSLIVAASGDPLGTTGALPLSAATHAASFISSAPEERAAKASAVAAPKVTPAAVGVDAHAKRALSTGTSGNGMQIMPKDKFGLPDLSALISDLKAPSANAASSGRAATSSVPLKSSVMRREVEPHGVQMSDAHVGEHPQHLSRISVPETALSENGPRTITSDLSMFGHTSMGAKEGRLNEHLKLDQQGKDEQPEHGFPWKEDPRLSPEAIYADHDLAPDIAEFLGHLGQRNRAHRGLDTKASHVAGSAGLVEGSQGKAVAYPEGANDEDIEDLRVQAANRPKNSALAYFFETLDSKATAASWSAEECAALAKNLTTQHLRMKGKSHHTSWATMGPSSLGRAEVHTAMFFKHWNVGTVQQAARKLRLSVLSFLATQDAGRVKLHIWTDLDNRNSSLREILGPIAYHPELMDAINITQFDPKVEFSKVPSTLARETLKERYKNNELPHLRQDLLRSVILYNYGGIWMDADTVMMQDVAPLIREDWAYLLKGKQGVVEGALLSVSSPGSHFANEYLMSYVMRQPPITWAAEVPTKERPLLVEVFNGDPAHTTLHVLPPCFMDSDVEASGETAVLAAGLPKGSSFFSKVVPEPYRGNFAMGIREALEAVDSTGEVSVLQDPAFEHFRSHEKAKDKDGDKTRPPSSPSFAYHYRGNWAAPWKTGSLADVAERTFMKKLNIQSKPSKP